MKEKIRLVLAALITGVWFLVIGSFPIGPIIGIIVTIWDHDAFVFVALWTYLVIYVCSSTFAIREIATNPESERILRTSATGKWILQNLQIWMKKKPQKKGLFLLILSGATGTRPGIIYCAVHKPWQALAAITVGVAIKSTFWAFIGPEVVQRVLHLF